MKKIVSLLLALCLMLSLAACEGETGTDSGPEEKAPQTEQDAAENKQPEAVPEESDEQLEPFQQTATLAETVMVEENGIKITATGLRYTNYSVELALTIENNSGKDLSFISGSMGYSCNAVNGYMVNDGYLNCDVTNGKKANDSIEFGYNQLMLYGINEIADIEIGFEIQDADYNATYTGPRQVKTSAYDTHDYAKDCFQETIASTAARNTYDYDMLCFAQDAGYSANGVNLLSSGLMVNQDGETILLLELENTTSNPVYLSTSDIALNGLLVNSATWSMDAINPGRRGILDVVLSDVLEAECWGVYGIQEIGTVSLALGQYDLDGNELAGKAAVSVAVPDRKAVYDAAGTEIYNKNGLRIAAKTVQKEPGDYSGDLYVLLLAENHSGKTLAIDDVYNSLSVNGFMTDYFFEKRTLADGESAAVKIVLRESSLEDNAITSAADVQEVEIGLEIEEGRNTVDEPVIKITFA